MGCIDAACVTRALFQHGLRRPEAAIGRRCPRPAARSRPRHCPPAAPSPCGRRGRRAPSMPGKDSRPARRSPLSSAADCRCQVRGLPPPALAIRSTDRASLSSAPTTRVLAPCLRRAAPRSSAKRAPHRRRARPRRVGIRRTARCPYTGQNRVRRDSSIRRQQC